MRKRKIGHIYIYIYVGNVATHTCTCTFTRNRHTTKTQGWASGVLLYVLYDIAVCNLLVCFGEISGFLFHYFLAMCYAYTCTCVFPCASTLQAYISGISNTGTGGSIHS